jgi:hypothetical protein
LTKLVVESPLGKFDLGDQHGFDPVAAFHNGRGDALTRALTRALTPSYLVSSLAG